MAEFKARCLRIIKEMMPRRGAVTITNRGRPVAVLSPVPASEETHSGLHRNDAGDGGEVRRSLRTGDLAFRLVGLAVILIERPSGPSCRIALI